MAKKLYKPREPFVTHLEGQQIGVAMHDRAREGHPILAGRDDLWVEADETVRFEWPPPGDEPAVEQATAAPGEKRAYKRRTTKD